MKLPASLYSTDQLTSILWEIEDAVASAHKDNSKTQLSRAADQFLAMNEIRELNNETIKAIHGAFETLRANAKQIHVVTGAASSSEWREKIIQWLRKEIDAAVFCSFAVNTEQGGGIVLRTPKKQYDLTLRGKLLNNKERLVEMLQS